MELIDLYDRQKRNTHKTFERWSGEPEKGKYKQSVHIWVMNHKGELLIQKRSENRRRNPGKWGFTGGMVDKGETSLVGAVRELKEELGIEVTEDKMDFIISFKREHVFVDVWLLEYDVAIEKLNLQEEEVSEAKWVTVDELKNMIENGQFVQSIHLYWELLIKILKNCYELKERELRGAQ